MASAESMESTTWVWCYKCSLIEQEVEMKKTIDSIRDTNGLRPFLLVTLRGTALVTNAAINAKGIAGVQHTLYRLRSFDARLLARQEAIQKPRCVAEAAGEVCRRAQDGFPHSHWPR